MKSGMTQPIEMDSGITQPIEIKPRITHEIEKKPRITQTIEMKPWMAPHIAMGRREQCRDEPDGGQQEPRRHHQRMQPQMCVTAARQEKTPEATGEANHEECETTNGTPRPRQARRQNQSRCPIAPNQCGPLCCANYLIPNRGCNMSQLAWENKADEK